MVQPLVMAASSADRIGTRSHEDRLLGRMLAYGDRKTARRRVPARQPTSPELIPFLH